MLRFRLVYDGNDESWVAATRRMNALLHAAQEIPEDQSDAAVGELVLVGHPDHIAHGPWVDLHGTLNILHAGISTGRQDTYHDGQQTLLLHRLALGGCLSLDPMGNILDNFREHLRGIRPDHWRPEPPSPEHIHLYRMPIPSL